MKPSELAPLPPPPKHPEYSTPKPPKPQTTTRWQSLKRGSVSFGGKAMNKGISWSDAIGLRMNNAAHSLGCERFYPTSNDFQEEVEKCERIIKTFTVDGVAAGRGPADESPSSSPSRPISPQSAAKGKGKPKGKPRRPLKKIPASVLRDCAGVAIFTSCRVGNAPLGGAGGCGMVVAHHEDGTWSQPASISPNSLTAGLFLGADIYDAVLVIRTKEALSSFFTHKATLGTDIACVAGPWGMGAAYEVGKEKAPVFSYVKSKGFYAGIALVGQVFVERFDENGNEYYWPGVKASDVLEGRVKPRKEHDALLAALELAASGKAQLLKPDVADLEVDEDGVVTPVIPPGLVLQDGEILRLPPTPSQSSEEEKEAIERELRFEDINVNASTQEQDDINDPKKRNNFIWREWEEANAAHPRPSGSDDDKPTLAANPLDVVEEKPSRPPRSTERKPTHSAQSSQTSFKSSDDTGPVTPPEELPAFHDVIPDGQAKQIKEKEGPSMT